MEAAAADRTEPWHRYCFLYYARAINHIDNGGIMKRIAKKLVFTAGLLSALCLAGATTSEASLVTSSPGGTVIDFSQFSGGWLWGAGPTQVGSLVGDDVVFTSTTTNSVIGDGTYGFLSNGYWSGKSGAGLNTSTGTMTFTFNSGLISSVGAFMNYVPDAGYGGDVIISVYDSLSNLLESYNINALAPISTPGGLNAGAFRGIVRSSADIKYFTLSNAYVMIDDLTYSPIGGPTPAPEPSTLLLLGGGIMALGLGRKRITRFFNK